MKGQLSLAFSSLSSCFDEFFCVIVINRIVEVVIFLQRCTYNDHVAILKHLFDVLWICAVIERDRNIRVVLFASGDIGFRQRLSFLWTVERVAGDRYILVQGSGDLVECSVIQ